MHAVSSVDVLLWHSPKPFSCTHQPTLSPSLSFQMQLLSFGCKAFRVYCRKNLPATGGHQDSVLRFHQRGAAHCWPLFLCVVGELWTDAMGHVDHSSASQLRAVEKLPTKVSNNRSEPAPSNQISACQSAGMQGSCVSTVLSWPLVQQPATKESFLHHHPACLRLLCALVSQGGWFLSHALLGTRR